MGDTVDILEELSIPIVIGIGDIGKMNGHDNYHAGAKITSKALEYILAYGRIKVGKISEKQSVLVNKKYEENIKILDRELEVKKALMLFADISIAGKKASLYFLDGFAKDDIMLHLMERWSFYKRRLSS